MPDSSDPSDGPSFAQELASLIERTYGGGNDVEGAWKCSTDGDFHWDVQITRVEYEGQD